MSFLLVTAIFTARITIKVNGREQTYKALQKNKETPKNHSHFKKTGLTILIKVRFFLPVS
jgi:hypothetical protein